jgi:hypothetical protein
MEVVKKTDQFTIFKKKSGRFAVKSNKNKWINGNDKVKILVSENLLKVALPAEKPAEEAPAEEASTEAEAPAEEAAAESEAPAEEAPEEAPAE